MIGESPDHSQAADYFINHSSLSGLQAIFIVNFICKMHPEQLIDLIAYAIDNNEYSLLRPALACARPSIRTEAMQLAIEAKNSQIVQELEANGVHLDERLILGILGRSEGKTFLSTL